MALLAWALPCATVLHAANSQTVFFDDFDGYTPGNSIDGSGSWYAAKGTAADMFVAATPHFNYQPTGPDTSVNGNAIGLKPLATYCGPQVNYTVTEDAYFDVRVFTPSRADVGAGGVAAMVLRGTDNTVFLQISLNASGSITVRYCATAGSSTQTAVNYLGTGAHPYSWAENAWQQVSVHLVHTGTNQNAFTLYLNGYSDPVGENQSFSYGTGTDGTTLKEGVYWFSSVGSNANVYFDNFSIAKDPILPDTYVGANMPGPVGSSTATTALFAMPKDNGTGTTATTSMLGKNQALLYDAHQSSSTPPYVYSSGVVYTTSYYPSLRDLDQSHTFAWYRTNHPEWLAYRYDGNADDPQTLAQVEQYPGHPATEDYPIDFSNPAVREYILNAWLLPQFDVGYQAVAFDNVFPDNVFDFQYTYDPTTDTFVHLAFNGQNYQGTRDDPAFGGALNDYLTWIRNEVHFRGAAFLANLHVDTNGGVTQGATMSALRTEMTAIPDLWLLEGGFGVSSQLTSTTGQVLQLAGTGAPVAIRQSISTDLSSTLDNPVTYGVQFFVPSTYSNLTTLDPIVLRGTNSLSAPFLTIGLNNYQSPNSATYAGMTVTYDTADGLETATTQALNGPAYTWAPGVWNSLSVVLNRVTGTGSNFTVELNGTFDPIGFELPLHYGANTFGTTAAEDIVYQSNGSSPAYFDNFYIQRGIINGDYIYGANAKDGFEASTYSSLTGSNSVAGQGMDGHLWSTVSGSSADATIYNTASTSSPFAARLTGYHNYSGDHYDFLVQAVVPKVSASDGQGFVDFNYMNTSLAAGANSDANWALASYLLVKGNRSYLAAEQPNHDYPTTIVPAYPAYWTPNVGTPSAAPLATVDGLWVRDYSRGHVIINSSATLSRPYTVPAGTWVDFFGNSVNPGTYTLSGHTALILSQP